MRNSSLSQEKQPQEKQPQDKQPQQVDVDLTVEKPESSSSKVQLPSHSDTNLGEAW